MFIWNIYLSELHIRKTIVSEAQAAKADFSCNFPLKAIKTAALMLCWACLLQFCPYYCGSVRACVPYRRTHYPSWGILKQEPPKRNWGRVGPVGPMAQQRHQATLHTLAGGPRATCSLQQPYVFRQIQSLTLGRQHNSHCCVLWMSWYVLTTATMNFAFLPSLTCPLNTQQKLQL